MTASNPACKYCYAQQPHVALANPIHLDLSAYAQALAVRCGPRNHEVLVRFLPRP